MTDIRPARRLTPGSKIGLFSPSEPLTADRRARMAPSLAILEREFELRWATNAYASAYYQAGTVAERLGDIEELVDDPDVGALLATWGGKSCGQLVEGLPYAKIAARRVPVAGFSDAGVLLNAITARSGVVTYYGPNIAGKLTESEHPTLDLARGEDVPPFGFGAQSAWQTITPGVCDGTLVGGGLSTFAIGLGGSRLLDAFEDPIFFWESGSSPPQIIDQLLTGLDNSGFLRRIRAMVVGHVLYEEVDRKNRPIDDLLAEVGTALGIPVVRIPTFGHLSTENPMIPIGARVHLDTEAQEIRLLGEVSSA